MSLDGNDQTEQDELQLLTIEQVAQLVNVHHSTVREWIASGELGWVQFGEGRKFVRKRVPRSEVARFIDRHMIKGR